jgi:hypothetical protein
MNAGLPGTGIGGLFYIAGALLMPFRMLRDAGRKERRARVRALPQIAIAVGILASLFATGWLLGFLLPPDVVQARLGGPVAMLRARSIVRVGSVLGTVGILLLVLASVEVATLLVRATRKEATRRAPAIVPARAGSPPDLSEVA